MAAAQIHPFLRQNTRTIIPFLDRIIGKSPTDAATSRAFATASPSTFPAAAFSPSSSSNPSAFTRTAQVLPTVINVLPATSHSTPPAPIIINNNVGGNNGSTTGAAKPKSEAELEVERKKAEEEKKQAEDKNAFIIGTVTSLFSTFAMGYLWGTYTKAKENYDQSLDLKTRANLTFDIDDSTQDYFMGLFRELSTDQFKIDESTYHINSRLLGSSLAICTGGALTFISSFINTSGALRTSARVAGYFSLLVGTGVGLFTFGLWLSSGADKAKLAQMTDHAQQIKNHIQPPAYNQPSAFAPEDTFYVPPHAPGDGYGGFPSAPSAPPLSTANTDSRTFGTGFTYPNLSTGDKLPGYQEQSS